MARARKVELPDYLGPLAFGAHGFVAPTGDHRLVEPVQIHADAPEARDVLEGRAPLIVEFREAREEASPQHAALEELIDFLHARVHPQACRVNHKRGLPRGRWHDQGHAIPARGRPRRQAGKTGERSQSARCMGLRARFRPGLYVTDVGIEVLELCLRWSPNTSLWEAVVGRSHGLGCRFAASSSSPLFICEMAMEAGFVVLLLALDVGHCHLRPSSFLHSRARTAVVMEARATPVALEETDPGEVAGLRVLKYPHPLLRAENAEVISFDDELRDLSRRMLKMMYASKGVGLAAPQVGVNQRLMVFNPEGDERKIASEVVLVNPFITASSDGTEIDEEGCLSFPGFGAKVERPKWVKVKAFNLKGKAFTRKYSGWEARIFQHEYDHLDGVLYVDRLSPDERALVQQDLDKLVADHGPGGAL